jgi:hypothetical protein
VTGEKRKVESLGSVGKVGWAGHEVGWAGHEWG